MPLKTKLLSSTLFVSVLALFSLVLYHLIGSNNALQKHIDELTAQNKKQSRQLIAQQTELITNNHFARLAAQENQINESKSQEAIIEYRTIFKQEPTCHYPVPNVISDGLQQHYSDVRNKALHAITRGTDRSYRSELPSTTLTYCQLGEWVELLLSELEQANNKLIAIQAIEERRQNEKA